jgi:WD40 repeat protein
MDCTVRVWDVISGIESGPLIAEHENDLVKVVFSPDGSHIASVSYGGIVRVWDAMLKTEACPPLQDDDEGDGIEIRNICPTPIFELDKASRTVIHTCQGKSKLAGSQICAPTHAGTIIHPPSEAPKRRRRWVGRMASPLGSTVSA